MQANISTAPTLPNRTGEGALIFHQGFVTARLIPGAIGRFLLFTVAATLAVSHMRSKGTPHQILIAAMQPNGLTNFLAVAIAVAGVLIWWKYKRAQLKAHNLVIDHQGVWVESGVFPWDKSRHGQLWGNIGGAGHPVGFTSWSSDVFDVQVFHRFTNQVILEITDVKHGNVAVAEINQVLSRPR